ncbi:hypothetical protein Ddye_023185 [Dipteronia dyeriana]|uniref:RNase H type-1 domain-containing protein n=1 Tax=Dipteronia dyeriana TaxID=168575 RepID=A0AAD9TSH5_9ROSI|nr:hypothetical protein Ddye_023185 [Dipteronia dyeriana]
MMDDEVVLWSSSILDDFRRANFNPPLVRHGLVDESIKWKPPVIGIFKVNTDAAIDSKEGRVGLGIMIRDCEGFVLASSAQIVKANFPPQLAEALALLKGSIQFAYDSGLWPCQCEYDVLAVVNMVCSNDPILTEIGIVIQDFKSLLFRCNDNSISFVPRMANMAAHCLAKIGLDNGFDSFWLEEFPTGLNAIVLSDLSPSENFI